MCFHASLVAKSQQIELQFEVSFANDSVKSKFDTPQYHLNGFEHPDLAIITQEAPDLILPAVWGLAPTHQNPEFLDDYYSKASKFGGGLNARSEKLTSHFLYKSLFKVQRCLVIVTAFYEPHKYKNTSFPYIIKRQDSKPFALAGLYTRFNNGLVTCAILTKDAMPFLAEIHNVKKRQPVILSRTNEKNWLCNFNTTEDIFSIINQDIDANELQSYPVNKQLFSPKVNSNVPSILEQVSYPELNRLF